MWTIKPYFFLSYHRRMTINLNEKETNIILHGLGELPAKESVELIIKLRMAWNEQEEVRARDAAAQKESPVENC